MRVLAVVPARGGSKGIPRKNLAPLAGRPLIAYTIQAALAATRVERCVVSTEDAEIANVSRGFGAEVVPRPAPLARDETPTLPVLQHAIRFLGESEGYRPDAVLTLQPTSPLRTARHIDEAVAMFVADPYAQSLVSCIEVPHVFHPRSVMRRGSGGYLEPYLEGPPPTRRQEKEPVFARNGAAIYITRTECLDRFIFGGRLLCYLMDEASSIDVDSGDDLVRAEQALTASERGFVGA